MEGGPHSKTHQVAPRSPPRPNPLAGRKVLVVDDDRASAAHVLATLASEGYTLLEAHNGAQALSVLRAQRPDLLVMDVEMPGLGGVEVCRIIKANQGEEGFGFVPIILVTARQGSRKVEGLELGADDYLVKPFVPEELCARVKSMLRLKALQDALVEKNRELEEANRELDRKREELLALSRTDSLTGLANRRHFEERLAQEVARADRYSTPLSCVLLDVDHFKRLNDTFGHPFGDEVLRQVSQAARGVLREVDVLARYGGEELVALLPQTGPQEALAVAERVRQSVEALVLPYRSTSGELTQVRCTASLGVATLPLAGLTSATRLLQAADTALYAAKQAGRNRVRQSPT
jgi:two-component system cell cycle response regulator